MMDQNPEFFRMKGEVNTPLVVSSKQMEKVVGCVQEVEVVVGSEFLCSFAPWTERSAKSCGGALGRRLADHGGGGVDRMPTETAQ